MKRVVVLGSIVAIAVVAAAVGARAQVQGFAPVGKITRFHKALGTMLNTPGNDEAINAIILLTDGHDFELVNPVKTGTLARNRQSPIYAVALGKYFLRAARPLHRHSVKHGRAQDNLFDRFDREASAHGSIRKNRRAFLAAPRKFGTDSE